MSRLGVLRAELRHIYRAFFVYRRGFQYLYVRYLVAPGILVHRGVLDRPPTDPGLSMHIVFGAPDFLMALWSLASFYRYASFRGQLHLHDDGSLTRGQKSALARLLPSARMVTKAAKIPWQEIKLIETNTDPDARYFLILDSDLLWFGDPIELRSAIDRRACVMLDGIDPCPMRFADGTWSTPEEGRMNSGVVGYPRDAFTKEALAKYLMVADRASHFWEQIGFAHLLPNIEMLPANRYMLKGNVHEAVLRHYTGPQREKFWCHGLNFIWRDILKGYVRD